MAAAVAAVVAARKARDRLARHKFILVKMKKEEKEGQKWVITYTMMKYENVSCLGYSSR